MRIGLAVYNFDPKKGGAERYTFDLASRLAHKGHHIVLFCARGVDTPGIELVRLNTLSFPRWLRSLSFALRHREAVRSGRFNLDVMLGFGNTLEFDVFQSHGGIQKVWMEREIASYEESCERTLKGFLLRNSVNQRVQRWIAETPIRKGRFRRIVAISEMVKQQMMAYYGLSDDRFTVVYNGVDTERFRPAPMKATGTLRVIFSAGNFRLKGLMPLLLALGRLSRTGADFNLTIMGRGRRERYDPLIRDLGIGDRITFLGETPSPEIFYREAHVLVHPTFYDACSLTTMEAMASGIPVITTKWNGAAALVSPGTGWVIDEPYDIDGICEALGSLTDEGLRERMGRAARLAMEQHTMERNADAMELVLEEARVRMGP